MCQLTVAENLLNSFIDNNPEINWLEKHGGGFIRKGSNRWTRAIKKTTHDDRGDTAITIGFFSGRGWVVGVCRADSAGQYRNADYINDKLYKNFYRAAVAFLEEVENLI